VSASAKDRLIRWGKFNLVGAVGMAVQLGALAVFNRVAPGHYLWACAAAIELTLVHNFVWHLRYTWCDRRMESTVLAQLWRFHLSNGLVSMAGNLVLMRLLVQQVRMPLIAANAVAIACCSIVNFWLGDAWAFAAKPSEIDAGCEQLGGSAG
jgi:putative flippase GtrA